MFDLLKDLLKYTGNLIYQIVPKSFKPVIKPFLIFFGIVMINAIIHYAILKDPTVGQMIGNVIQSRSFIIINLLTIAAFSTLIVARLFARNRAWRVGAISLILIVTLTLTVAVTRKSDRFKNYYVNIYPIGVANYNDLVLNHLLTKINHRQQLFHFRIVDTDNGQEVSAEIPGTDEGVIVEESVNKKHFFTYLSKKDKIDNEEVKVGLTSKRLQNNLFSATWIRHKITIVSTIDLDSPVLNPNADSLLIYKYIIVKLITSTTVSHCKVLHHVPYEFQGCIFDYKFNKREIINNLLLPNICQGHAETIKNSCGQEFLAGVEAMLTFDWIDEKVESEIKSLQRIE